MKNKNQVFYHKETGFLFDEKTKRVTGTEGCNFKLSREDIQKCKELNLKYILPETLEDDRQDVILEVIEDANSDSYSDTDIEDIEDDLLSLSDSEYV